MQGSVNAQPSKTIKRCPAEIKPEGRTPYTSKVPEGTPCIEDDPPA